MKRLRSSEDLDSSNDKNAAKEPSNSDRPASSSHRTFFHKSFSSNSFARKGPISPSRYDRDRQPFMAGEDVGYSRVLSRRRLDRDFDGGFENRRKELDSRYREDRLYRSESACFTRRDFPKGFRSERERPRREGSVSSWRRFGGRGKEFGGEERERGGASLRLRDGERDRERNVKSPSWSRDSGSEQSKMKAGVCGESKDSRDSRNSRSKSKSLASPTWSKDSGSEQSKSVGNVAKKSEEEVQGKNGGSSSEMEEGELEPEPQPETPSAAAPSGDRNKGKEPDGLATFHREAEIESSRREIRKDSESDDDIRETSTESNHGEVDGKMDEVEGSGDKKSVEKAEDMAEQVAELHVSENNVDDSATANASNNETGDNRGTGTKNEIRNMDADEGEKEEENEGNRELKWEEHMHLVVAERFHSAEELKHDKGSDLDVKREEVEAPKCVEEAAEGNGRAEEYMNTLSNCSDQKCKDKGKSVVLTPTRFLDSIGNGALTEGESGNLAGRNRDEEDNLEGPSIRGFELFSSSPVRKSYKSEQSGINKPKDEKLLLEPLDLSLSLPDVLLPIGGGQDTNPPPGSPGCSRSVRSFTNTFCTNSDGFTMSMSFSGSQSFHHNPSCSLNQNAVDNEQSVHSRPIFQGVDWQALSQNDSRNKENSVYQRMMENGNGSIQPQALKGISSSGQAAEGRLRLAEGSSKASSGLEKQLSFQKCIDVRSPCPSMGSHENGSRYSFEMEKAKEMHGGSVSWINSLKSSGDDFVETVIRRILSDPMHVMAKKFHEMPVQYISSLKESIRQMMLNMDKRVQLCAFQDALLNRTDITLEVLQKSHHAQLEILVALKTGCPEFLQLDNSISPSDLADIFMKLRCKNLTCRNLVPVDECDCRVCARKDGFCSACMCLVCSNFDMASNTCSWVGCDVCLHWCHTDCGLRESYIRNGNSASGAQGTTEMQFHCVACNHPSEMFGFVKEVFQNFARKWKFEEFCKELEYVRRIFSASKDFRGRRLHEAADLMLARLTNKSIDLPEACTHILGVLSDCDSSNAGEGPLPFRKEQSKVSRETAGPSQDASWLKSVYSDRPRQLERKSSVLDALHRERQAEICPIEMDLKRNSHKEPLFEELESIVRIKQAEAEMFQARADDARREAEGLKRIAVAKNERIEEEYMSRIVKLSLAEAEEMRRKKYEEFQVLERAHRDYFDMKMRMEEEIRGLLLKMEATKQSLAL